MIKGYSRKKENSSKDRKEGGRLVSLGDKVVPYFWSAKEKLRLESFKFTEY